MPPPFTSACVHAPCHVYVNINSAGSAFKCQTFNLLDLTWGGVQACQSLTTTCRRRAGGKIRHKNKLAALKLSIRCTADWSVVRGEEWICSRTGGEQKVKAEGRWGGDKETRARREEGCYSHYVMNEVIAADRTVFAVEVLFGSFLCMLEPFELFTFMHTNMYVSLLEAWCSHNRNIYSLQ